MSKKTNSAALKRLERAKAEYEDAMRAFEREEEIRLALEREPIPNLRHVQIYSAYYNGAKKAFGMMADDDSFLNRSYGRNRAEDKVYRKAIFDLIKFDMRKVELFMSGADIGFCNHVQDKKGRVIKCDAYFFEECKIRKRIES